MAEAARLCSFDLRALMRGAFTEFTVSRPVLRNVPPAFVYGGRN